MAKRPTPIDPGLAEIDAWHQWFLSAHTQRLADLQLPPDQHDRELADVTTLATAVVARMRADLLSNRQRAAQERVE